MRQESKLAMICVSVSIKGWSRFMAFVPFCLSPKHSNQSTQALSFPDHLTNCTMIQLQCQVYGNWENVNIHACS